MNNTRAKKIIITPVSQRTVMTPGKSTMMGPGALLGTTTHAEVFSVLEGKKRDEVVKVVSREEVSLGMIDPVTGRSLLHKLLTTITNGDRVVLAKLDTAVSTTMEDQDQEDFSVVVDHRYLVDEDPRNLTLVRDLLDLPRKISTKVLNHPVIKTFIEKRWMRTRWTFLISFFLYLSFVILFTSFLVLMYQRQAVKDQIRIPVKLPKKCDRLLPIESSDDSSEASKPLENRIGLLDPESEGFDVSQGSELTTRRGKFKFNSEEEESEFRQEFDLQLEVIKVRRNKTKLSRARKKLQLFSGCSSRRNWWDPSLCSVEILLLVSIFLLIVQEFWQLLAIGRQYFLELENWFELLIISFAISTMSLKTELDTLKIVAAVGICLAWIELIFLFGRYPFLGGMFSIMYYSITKRIIKTALAFFILICAFAFAFFIIHFGNDSESFDNVGRSFLKIFVMVLGEFEFDDLWESAQSSSSMNTFFTMLLLVFLVIFGSVTMVNLIVAIIISDIDWLHTVSRDQALLNQAHHAVQISSLLSLLRCLSNRVRDPQTPRAPVSLQMEICVHSVCSCGRTRPSSAIRESLKAILDSRRRGV